tara:strand:+ start:106 stop:849 length:744 start_codon:yes stop_codon:yes gene_type:complete
MKVLIKAMRPHRQKVLTEDGQEMRLQQWANKKAGAALRSSNVSGLRPHYSTEQFQQARDALMREAVANPDEHGLKFMGERVPFEGQTLEESLSEPDVEGERAAIDNQFKNRDEFGRTEEEQAMDAKPFMTRDDHDAEFAATQKNLFDEQGKLRQTLPQGEEEKKEFDADAEAEHLRRIMTSRDVAIRDAWSLLKQGPYDREGRYLEHQDINLCPEAKAFLQKEMTEGPQFRDKDPNFCNNCDFCYGK